MIEKSSNDYVRSILCIMLLSWFRMILTFHQSISFEPLAFLVIGYHQTEYFIIWMIWKGLVLNKYLKYIPWMYKLYKKSLISLPAMKHYYIIFTYFVMIVNKYDMITLNMLSYWIYTYIFYFNYLLNLFIIWFSNILSVRHFETIYSHKIYPNSF